MYIKLRKVFVHTLLNHPVTLNITFLSSFFYQYFPKCEKQLNYMAILKDEKVMGSSYCRKIFMGMSCQFIVCIKISDIISEL